MCLPFYHDDHGACERCDDCVLSLRNSSAALNITLVSVNTLVNMAELLQQADTLTLESVRQQEAELQSMFDSVNATVYQLSMETADLQEQNDELQLNISTALNEVSPAPVCSVGDSLPPVPRLLHQRIKHSGCCHQLSKCLRTSALFTTAWTSALQKLAVSAIVH